MLPFVERDCPMLRHFALALALAFTPSLVAPVMAQTTSASADIQAGRILRDAGNVRLGKIDRVNPDGSVRIILDERFVTIPAETLSVQNGEVTTSLTKKEVARLR